MMKATDHPGDLLRKYREANGMSLDRLADMLAERGHPRPSIAKLSRIECGQRVPLELLPALESITGIARHELRPDVAQIFAGAAQ